MPPDGARARPEKSESSLPQHQAAAVQARLERLVVQLQHAARFFCGQSVEVSEDHRLSIDCRQTADGAV